MKRIEFISNKKLEEWELKIRNSEKDKCLGWVLKAFEDLKKVDFANGTDEKFNEDVRTILVIIENQIKDAKNVVYKKG